MQGSILINNLLEIQDSPFEMSQNPLLFEGVLGVEEHVLGCVTCLDHELTHKNQENRFWGTTHLLHTQGMFNYLYFLFIDLGQLICSYFALFEGLYLVHFEYQSCNSNQLFYTFLSIFVF